MAAFMWLVGVGACVTLVAQGGTSPALAQTPTPPAGLDLQVTPSRQSVERDQPLDLFLLVKNKSNSEVKNLRVDLSNPDFTWVHAPMFPPTIAPYAGALRTGTIKATSSAQFTQQQIFLTFRYDTVVDNQQLTLMQGSAVPIQVVRRFDEETKGFLGGNAAFFYLLLPIIPLFLGYQLVNGKAMNGKFELPALKADYIAPAFLFAIILNLVLLLLFSQLQIDFSDPTAMLLILTGAFVIGAALAVGVRFDRLRKVFLRFRDSDTPLSYLRKLLTKQDLDLHEWVSGTDANNELWSGILLSQPIGAPALGATLQLTRNTSAPDVATLQRVVFNENNELRLDRDSRQKLLQLLNDGAFEIGYWRRIQQGTTAQGRKQKPVVTGFDGFKVVTRQVDPLVRLAL